MRKPDRADTDACRTPNPQSLTWIFGTPHARPPTQKTGFMCQSQLHSFQSSFRSLALWVLVLAVTSTGCTTLKLPALTTNGPNYQNVESGVPLGSSESEQVYHSVKQSRTQNAIVLQVVGAKKPVRILPLPADGRSVFLSDLIKQSGVTKRLGSIQPTLFRSSPDSIVGLPMDVKMASDGKSIRPESDYALRAGDRIRVQKAASPAMRGLLQTLMGI